MYGKRDRRHATMQDHNKFFSATLAKEAGLATRLTLGQSSKGVAMRGAVVLALGGTLLVGACGGDADDAAETSAASTTDGAGEPIVIRTRISITDEEGAETIATGEVLKGSTLGGSPFCAGGSILDTHPSPDPPEEPYLIERTITCPDGTVRVGLTPEVGTPGEPQDMTQTGSWTIVGGTDAFDGLLGSGEMDVTNDPDDDSLAHETLMGTVTS
jgi:hypothetical protein